jgi:hypothetical protein
MFKHLRFHVAPLPALALVVVGVIAVRAVTAQAPAFREELQVEGITGDTRLRTLSDMYDEGSYLFQMGIGYLNADVLSFAGLEAPDTIASFETAAQRLSRAETLLEASLRRDPANAHAWLAYAQSVAARGAFDISQAATVTSWHQAPTNTALAVRRLYLIETFRELTDTPDAMAEVYASDLALLRKLEPRLARDFLDS